MGLKSVIIKDRRQKKKKIWVPTHLVPAWMLQRGPGCPLLAKEKGKDTL